MTNMANDDPRSVAGARPMPSPSVAANFSWRQFAANRLRELLWAATFILIFGMSRAQAISLSELRIESNLGQPLDAVVYVTAAPGEVLTATCFTAAPAESTELPGLENIRLTLSRRVSPMALRLSTSQPVLEPLSELVLRVKCPGVPSISRTFWVMVNPPEIATDGAEAPPVAAAAPSRSAFPTTGRSVSRPRATGGERVRVYAAYAGPTSPIPPGETYVVQNGDVLSMIASRVSGRASNTVWELAEKIFSLNPAAFMSGDPDMLIAGSQIYIPLPSVPLALVTPPQPAAATAPPSTAMPAAPATVATTGGTQAPASVDGWAIAPSPAGLATGAPTVAATPAEPVRAMVLSTSLSALSISRIEQRRAGILPVPPPAESATAAANSGADEQPAPRAPADETSPGVAVTAPKVAVAPTTGSQEGSSLGWAAFVGLLLLVLLGVPALMFIFRRNVTRRYRDDLRKALRRRRYASELLAARQQHDAPDTGYSVTESDAAAEVTGWGEGAPDLIPDPMADTATLEAPPETPPEGDIPATNDIPATDDLAPDEDDTATTPLPAAGPSAMLANLLDGDRTMSMELPAAPLDIAVQPPVSEDEPPQDDSDLTLELETPKGAPDLDLELPDVFTSTAASDDEPTGPTNVFEGMEELDFDPELLALDYSKEYEASRKAEGEPEAPDDETLDSMGDSLGNELTLEAPGAPHPQAPEPATTDPADYYHLEAQLEDASSSESELSFEDDDADRNEAADGGQADEGNADDGNDDEDKVVPFPQQQSGQK